MRVPAQMPSQREWVLPQRQFRKPIKKVANTEQMQEERPQQPQADTERYQLQIDRQTERSFKTPDAARSTALEIKARFPALQVSIYDSVTRSRTLVDIPRSDTDSSLSG
jgi:hypothetical protein